MSEFYPKILGLVFVVLAVLSFAKLAPRAMALANGAFLRSSLALLLAVAVSVVAFACYLALATSIWGA